jgi:flagellar L-ring protein precursor FlgH
LKTRVLAWVLLGAAATQATAADDSSSMLNDSTYQSLVSATKALHVGDLLTVIVQESASAASSTDLHSTRNFNVSGQVTYGKAGTHSGSAGTGSSSDGTGTTQRSGKLLAQVSVRVNGINSNGDLVVAGQQSLKINGEEQRISLSGVVRPRDVGDDNTVLSSRIAEVKIRFDGAGFVSDQSKPGWLARFFNLLGL